MRGKLARKIAGYARSRITPADAGKTYLQAIIFCVTWDHPRGCGENKFCPARQRLRLGSPPRMRGKPHSLCNFGESFRITPADAGKTIVAVNRASVNWDHPRGCGENALSILKAAAKTGSPPRMRGKRPCGGIAGLIFGITPADAGKTFETCQSMPR